MNSLKIIINFFLGINSYSDLCKAIEKEINNFIKQTILNDKLDNIKVIVLSGIGKFQHTTFQGNTNNFFFVLYYNLLKLLLNNKKFLQTISNGSNIEVYLDITHGINYMTVLTYKALKDIRSLIADFCDIRFIPLNSDPFTSDNDSILTINTIEDIKILPQANILKYHHNIITPSSIIADNEKNM